MSHAAFEEIWSARARRTKGELRFARKRREYAVCAFYPRIRKTLGHIITTRLALNHHVKRSKAHFADALRDAPAPQPAERLPMNAAEIVSAKKRAARSPS